MEERLNQQALRGRWKVILGVLMVQIAGGALYIWSRFMGPLMSAYNYTANQTLWVYAITITCFTIGLILGARLLEKVGPKSTASIGAVLFGGGVILSSFTTSVVPLALTYGVLGGLGSGVMYLAPLTTLVRWFPQNKGLANGICIMGFALATLIFVPIANVLLGSNETTPAIMKQTFLIMGFIYLVMSLIGARMLKFPKGTSTKVLPETDSDIKPVEAIRSVQFWLVAGTVLFGCIPGIFLISSAAKLGQTMVGLTPAQASLSVMALGIFNALGRLMAGWMSDKLYALRAYRIVFTITTLSVALLAFIPVNIFTFAIAFIGIVIGFGATVTLLATVILALFGPKYYGINVAYVMLAYGASALTATMIKMYGNLDLTQVFTASFIASVLAQVLVMLIKPYAKKENVDILES